MEERRRTKPTGSVRRGFSAGRGGAGGGRSEGRPCCGHAWLHSLSQPFYSSAFVKGFLVGSFLQFSELSSAGQGDPPRRKWKLAKCGASPRSPTGRLRLTPALWAPRQGAVSYATAAHQDFAEDPGSAVGPEEQLSLAVPKA